MKRTVVVLVLSLSCVSAALHAQESRPTNQDALTHKLAADRSTLLSELHSLDEQSSNLSALAQASIRAELADAAWDIDRVWSKQLLMKAYTLTWPTEDNSKVRDLAVGSRPVPPVSSDRARRSIRNRIVEIAGREQKFVDELIQSGVKILGNGEGQMAYASLAASAWHNNDLENAGKYVMQSADLDPSQIAAGLLIADMARSDRKKADELIIQYLQRLMSFPLSSPNNSVFRVYLVVNKLVFPPADVKAPGVGVMRAYVAFVIQSLGSLEQREPGSLRMYRTLLLLAYPPAKQYAPDLMPEFVALEEKSRAAGSINSPDADLSELMNRMQQNRDKISSENETPTERQIDQCISNHDFAKARKLVDKLPDVSARERLGEVINTKEALYLLGQNNIFQARTLAEKLQQATSIQDVYVSLISKCITNRNDSLAQDVMIQAMKQLRRSNPAVPKGPIDLPVAFAPTSQDVDPILEGMAKLTVAVSPSSFDVAFLGLGETVAAANQSELDTTQGRAGFDMNIFKKLAPNDEPRVRLAAESFKDPFRRLLSLTAIYQWKASNLTEREKSLRANSKTTTIGATKN